jgi:hypothetical protein
MRYLPFYAAIAALTLLTPAGASAQEDTTPPVLLNFTISPALFDTGPGLVDISWCVTVADDLSGVRSVSAGGIGPLIGGTNSDISLGQMNFADTTAPTTQCATATAQQFTPYGTYLLTLIVRDALGNNRHYDNPEFRVGFEDLCPLADHCELVNTQLGQQVDTDGDGILDDADNCPDDSNGGQEDRDLDLIGDVCDPFPDDRDNAQAQCETDLDEALADLEMCMNPPAPTPQCSDGIDNDGDGFIDLFDRQCRSADQDSERHPNR